MPVTMMGGSVQVMLTPTRRRAPDDLRGPLTALLAGAPQVDVASQQMADRGLVDALAGIRSIRGGRARVLVEADYLTEDDPVPPAQVWLPVGRNDEHRQCAAALGRAGITVRTDVVGSALQHVNLVVVHEDGDPATALVSSANLAPGSLDTHLNWAVRLDRPLVAKAAAELFEGLWDGDFRDAAIAESFGDTHTDGRLVAGADGQATDEALEVIAGARERIRFAWFAMSRGARVVAALAEAAARGVDVAGIVDGDQGLQPWNAVPDLRAAGVDVRYHPGALTGAIGRMHLKSVVADRTTAHLSTANASHAAERSLELAVTLTDPGVAVAVDAEIVHRGRNSSIDVLVPL